MSAVIKYFDKKFGVLKQQTVSDYKRKYGEIAKETESGGAEIKSKKRGRPSLLPEELMSKSIEIIKSLRLKGAPVSYAVMAAVVVVYFKETQDPLGPSPNGTTTKYIFRHPVRRKPSLIYFGFRYKQLFTIFQTQGVTSNRIGIHV